MPDENSQPVLCLRRHTSTGPYFSLNFALEDRWDPLIYIPSKITYFRIACRIVPTYSACLRIVYVRSWLSAVHFFAEFLPIPSAAVEVIPEAAAYLRRPKKPGMERRTRHSVSYAPGQLVLRRQIMQLISLRSGNQDMMLSFGP